MIMAMRKETQLPLKNCREALQETNWDFEAAKVHLKNEAKRLGLKKMASLGKFYRLKISFETRFQLQELLLKDKWPHSVKEILFL